MQLSHVRAHNFKTYVALDLDLRVTPERPIVLIGGVNGGGKTTFFQAINGALYGLDIPDEKTFRQLLNVGLTQAENAKIELEISFTGKVLQQEKSYKLKRIYTLNSEHKVVQSVTLSMDGNIFTYGTASTSAVLKENKTAIDKIIKANLPHELSRYFLFDALEAGNLLKEDQLNRVIRDNIENVMGFKKYNELAAVALELYQDSALQRQKDEIARAEYQKLLQQKTALQKELATIQTEMEDCQDYAMRYRETYNKLKEGKKQDLEIEKRMKNLEKEIQEIETKEKNYNDQLKELVNRIEEHVSFPYLQKNLQDEIRLALNASQTEENQNSRLSAQFLTELVESTYEYLKKSGALSQSPSVAETVEFILNRQHQEKPQNPYHFLETAELKELDNLLRQNYPNGISAHLLRQNALNQDLNKLELWRREFEEYRSKIKLTDDALIREFEENQAKMLVLEDKKSKNEAELKQVEKKINSYDLDAETVPDPRHETLHKLKPFFEAVSNQLLNNKKRQIEAVMLADLNANLNAYQDVIDRVELSDQLRDLSFKIYHKAGNEIYLNLLNTASKQVVVQVLLKALHELGDYDPPVMIDTVMGALDKASRATVLENYFPKLAHQTILLSSDSEIDPETDFAKINAFVSKAYTLHRDRNKQCTTVDIGYFDKSNFVTI